MFISSFFSINKMTGNAQSAFPRGTNWPEQGVATLCIPRLWVECVLPKFMHRILILSVTVSGDGPWMWLCCEGGALMKGISALIRGSQRAGEFCFVFLHSRTQWKGRCLQPRRGFLPESGNAGTWFLTLWLQKCDKWTFIVYEASSLWCCVIAALAFLRH